MENNNSKIYDIGQLAVIAVLELIMILFRLVQPIKWPGQMQTVWQGFGNDFVFFGIECVLVIIIVAHFIYNHSFKELGFTRFKDNIGTLIMNLCFVGICVAAAFVGSQLSKNVDFNGLEIILSIIANFIAIAWIRELVFRGFLFNVALKLTGGRGLIASVLSAFFFTFSVIPDVLLSSTDVQMTGFILTFLFGLYLGLVYYYGRNLWVCTIIHGVCLTLASFEPDIFITLLAALYLFMLVIYLGYKMVRFYKYGLEDEEENPESEEEKTEPVDLMEDTLLESTSETSPVEVAEPEVCEIPQEEVAKEFVESEVLKEDRELSKVIQVPNFKVVEEVDSKIESADCEDDDLAQSIDLSRTQEELGKVVHLEARKAQLAKEAKEEIQDIIMPGAEPNFIAHLEAHLGEFEGIYKQMVPTEPPIDILFFSGEKYDALVTNGMRAMPMSMPSELEEYKQIELMMFVDKSLGLSSETIRNEKNAWLVKLLTELAVYPRLTNSYLGWGHIVGNGPDLEPYNECIAYCGALIYPPMDQMDMALHRYVEKDNSIFIYNVMPLYQEELRFVQEQSSDAFINLLCTMGIKQAVVPERINVIEAMKQQ